MDLIKDLVDKISIYILMKKVPAAEIKSRKFEIKLPC